MHVCICLSLSDGVLCRPTLKTLQAVCGLTSIFSSLVESSLFRIHPPLCPCLMVTVPLRLQRGWSTYTGLHILSCVGCQPSWLSGLVRTCRMSWDFPTKLTRGPSLVRVGPPLSWIISCSLMLLMVPWVPLDVWIGSQTCAGASCVPDVIHLICQNIDFTDLTQRYWYIHCKDMYIHVTYMYVSFQFGKYTYKHIVDMYIQCLWRVSINFVYTSKYLVYTC